MPTPWAARLGLVFMSALALAACNRGQQAGSAATSDAARTAAAPGADMAPASGGAAAGAPAAERLSRGEATASAAPAPSPAAVAAAPEIAAAHALDEAVSSGSAGDTQAYGFLDDGGQVRVWDEGSRGSRIVLPDGAISYYRSGASDPYLLRQGETFYVLSGGRVVRAYDARGRAVVLQPAVRSRVETVITRTRTVRRNAEQRRPPAAHARDAAKVQAAQDNARDANKSARQVEKQADRARDSAEVAQHAANRADRQAETPRQEDKARDAQRQANKADRQADKAADKAKDADKAARDARQLAAQCARQKARGQKVDKDCAA